MSITYNVQQRQVIVQPMPTGLTGFMSWERLIRELRRSGELLPSETLTHITASESGLHFTFDIKGDAQ